MTQPDLSIKDITPLMLQQMLATDTPPVVLDVRENEELGICCLSTFTHIPLSNLPQEFAYLPMDQTIVTLCHHGRRSFQAALFLKSQGFEHVLNLKGGIHAWAEQVDSQMKRY